MSDLDQRMRQVLAELELCSTTPAARLERTSASSERGLSLVVDAPNLQRRREEYDAAEGDGERLRVVERAEKALMELRHGSNAGRDMVRGTREFKRALANAEGTVRFVAYRFGVSESTVKRAKQEFKDAA